jgi:peptide/nickel transport system substrate-binding protein
VPLTQAGTKKLKGYTPSFSGPWSYSGGGLRRAWLES